MKTKQKIATLQEIISQGIGDRTQRALAIESGLTPEYLSRLMKKGFDSKITQSVLVSLASALPNTSKEELLSLFDYKEEDELKNLNGVELSAVFFDDFKNAVSRTLNIRDIYKSPIDFLNKVNQFGMVLQGVNITKLLSVNFDESNENHKNATYQLLRLTYNTVNYKLEFYLVLKYYSISDSVIVSRVIYDKDFMDDLFELKNNYWSKKLSIKTPYVCNITKNSNNNQNNQLAEPSESDNSEEVKRVIYGFGFYLPQEVTDEIKDFAYDHQTDIIGLPELEYLLASRKDLTYDQYKTVIINVLNNQNQMKFNLYEDTKNNKTAVIFEEWNKGYLSNNIVKILVKKYAKELGLDEYGEIHHILEETLKEDKLYKVNE